MEFVASLISRETGAFDDELQHLQKAIFHADRAGDLERAFWAQFNLASHLADRSGPEAVESLIRSLRSNATKLGDPKITAALHILVSLIDGKRGLLDTSLHHAQLAHRLLEAAPHRRVEAMGQTNLVAIAILRCDLEQALVHGEAALSTSTECGAVRLVRTCLINLGHIHYMRGNFDVALEHFRKVLALSETANEDVFVARESIAQVYLAQGEPERCLDFLDLPDELAHGIGRYIHRNSHLTKAKILGCLERWKESGEYVARTISLARQAGDEILVTIGSLFQTEVLLHLDQVEKAWNLVTTVAPTLASPIP